MTFTPWMRERPNYLALAEKSKFLNDLRDLGDTLQRMKDKSSTGYQLPVQRTS